MPRLIQVLLFGGLLLATSTGSATHSVTILLLKDDVGSKPNDITHINTDLLNITYIDVSHDWSVNGAWTLFPLIPRLAALSTDWVLVVNQRTKIHVGKISEVCSSYDKDKSVFVGHGLRDREPTVVHHYFPNTLVYPLSSSGFLLSVQLIKTLNAAIKKSPVDSSFSIDPTYEFAAYASSELNVQLVHDRRFCLEEEEDCLTSVITALETKAKPISSSELFVAVKTFSGFHETRVPVVKSTWGQDKSTVVYFSDTEDPSIPTLSTGLPNTQRGHCAKTAFILEYFHQLNLEGRNLKWLLVADDDTIISLHRLRALLSLHNSSIPLIMGERYGYSMSGAGYEYVTGGGGMVFSQSAVVELIRSGCNNCPTADTPDDMFLGACVKWQNIQIIHHEGFHQARPNDYPESLLKAQFVISFHKHWNIDPVSVYDQWFGVDRACRDEL